MRRRFFVSTSIRFLLILSGLFLSYESVKAQQLNLEELLKSNSYILEKEENRLSGNGLDFLLKASSDAQFFAFGEEHFVKEVPEIVTMLFAELHRKSGYDYLALESDPVSAMMVSGKNFLGNRKKIFELANTYQNSFTFNTDQELEMIYQVGKLSNGKGNRIWGVDQVFGAFHVLARLVELTPNKNVRERTAKLLRHAQQLDAKRRTGERFYMTTNVPKPEDFLTIAEWYQAPPNSEAEFLIRQLLLSERVFRRSVAANTENGVPVGYESVSEREENMKYLFMREYRLAESKDKRLPKVFLKLGQIHLIRGLSILNVPSFGNFISEFAKSNGSKSFHLYSYLHNPPGGFRAIGEKSWLKPFANVADVKKWTIFDLRPLRAFLYAKKLEVSPGLEKTIYSYDALLLIGGGSPSTSKETLAN